MNAHDAVHSELGLLAAELGVKPHGPLFSELVEKTIHAVEYALNKGDDSFENVQSFIDRQNHLASNLRRKPKYDIENAARNISRLRRSDPEPGLARPSHR